MIVINNTLVMVVAGRIVAVASADNGYCWATESTEGVEDNLMQAIKKAAQQATKEARAEENVHYSTVK